MTHTYALLPVSAAAYDEIAGKLKAAGYGHAFNADGEIDLTGIVVVKDEPTIATGAARDRLLAMWGDAPP